MSDTSGTIFLYLPATSSEVTKPFNLLQERVDEWMTDLVRNMSLKEDPGPGVVETVQVTQKPTKKFSTGLSKLSSRVPKIIFNLWLKAKP